MVEKQPSNDNNDDVLRKIDDVCAEFRRLWKAGSRPRMEEFVSLVDTNFQSTLFQKLLLIDLRYRQRDKKQPTSDEYLNRFPQFRRVIGDTFFESAIISMDENQSPVMETPVDQTVEVDESQANRLGEYDLIRKLGRGAFGIAYEAKHTTRGNRVALKQLTSGAMGQDIRADRLHRFRREFRTLAEINHPNLVGMQTLEAYDGKWFFTMDLVDGTDFLTYVRPDDQMDESRLRSALAQLVQGILALHDRRIIHRDLKPSNVFVEPNGRVVILDFGLVAELQKATDATVSRSAMFAGTPRYAAPEQMFGERSEASDWYAFGTMIYEALTGRSPFQGDQMEVLRQKQESSPKPLSGDGAYPQDLTQLVDGLLNVDPERRPSKDEIVDALQIDLDTKSQGLTHWSQSPSSSIGEEELDPLSIGVEEVELFGRSKQLSQLEAIKKSAQHTRGPRVNWIIGKSGEGKSALAEKFLRPLRRGDEFVVFSGRCYDRESVPFKAIDCWMDSFASFLRSKHSPRSELPQDCELLARIFPILKRVDAIDQMPVVDNPMMSADTLRFRGFGALRELLKQISEKTPVVVYVDDLQWGDGDSADAFRRILGGDDPPNLLLFGGYRSDEAETSPFLTAWQGVEASFNLVADPTSVEVAPLTLIEFEQLLEARFGDTLSINSTAVVKMHEAAAGNPYLLEQQLEQFDPESGEFRSTSVIEQVLEKLKRLPVEAKELLTAIAIAGQEITFTDLSTLAKESSHAYSILTHMCNERLVRFVGAADEPAIDTYHDKIREAVLNKLRDGERKSWHLRMGEMIQAAQQISVDQLEQQLVPDDLEERRPANEVRLFDLAFHFHEAGSSKAMIYQIAAAEQALSTYANTEALSLLQLAANLSDDNVPAHLRARIEYDIGLAFLGVKNPSLAAIHFEHANKTAPGKIDQAKACIGIGHAHSQLGNVRESVESCDIALANLNRSRPKTLIGKLAKMSFAFPRLAFVPSRWSVARNDDARLRAKLIFQAQSRVGIELLEIDMLGLLGTFSEAPISAFATNDYAIIANGHALAANILGAFGFHRLANRSARNFETQIIDISDPTTEAIGRYEIGNSYYFVCEAEKADASYRRSQELLERIGEYEVLLRSNHMHRHLMAYSNTSSRELISATNVLELANDLNSSKGRCWGHYDTGHPLSRIGRLEEAVSHASEASKALRQGEWNLTEGIFYSTLSAILFQCSDYAGARAAAEESWRIVTKHFLYFEWNVRSLPQLVEAIAGERWIERGGQQDSALGRKLCRKIALLHRAFPPLQPPMFRSAGRFYYSIGKKRKAKRLLQRSIRLAESRGMPWDHARSLLDLAAIDEQNREQYRSKAIQILKEIESVIPRSESWQLGDQYDEAVVAPEFDLARWEAEHGALVARNSSG